MSLKCGTMSSDTHLSSQKVSLVFGSKTGQYSLDVKVDFLSHGLSTKVEVSSVSDVHGIGWLDEIPGVAGSC